MASSHYDEATRGVEVMGGDQAALSGRGDVSMISGIGICTYILSIHMAFHLALYLTHLIKVSPRITREVRCLCPVIPSVWSDARPAWKRSSCRSKA